MARSQRRAEGSDLVEAEMPIVREAAPSILASLSEMTVPQLTEIIQRAESVRAEKLESERSAFLARIRSEAAGFGISLEEMIRPSAPARRGRAVAGGAKRASPPAKYKHPEGADTWSGRGRLPKWLAALEADGHKREEYLIEKPAT